jgi:acetyltransferase-like isoleucine patch superfamily enzyme
VLTRDEVRERYPDCTIADQAVIYESVELGSGSVICHAAVIGMAPRGKEPGELKTTLGEECLVRPFSTIYAGTSIGRGLQTGQGASIREDNIIGDDVSIGTHTVLEFGNRIGNHVRIHTACFLEMVTLEDYVFIGPGVVFTDDPHPMGCPRYKECLGGATVRELARVGANTTVLPGVTIGRNALVGAGSVVVDDVPEDAVVAGSPARVLKRIDELDCPPGFYRRPYVWEPYLSRSRRVKQT